MLAHEIIMSTVRFTDEFKCEGVKQVTEYKRPVADVAQRLGVSTRRGRPAYVGKS